jgi:site-specific DNA-methyltransferase (cytosine-N4-specific)
VDVTISEKISGGVSHEPVYKTDLGAAYCGDSAELLASKSMEDLQGAVQLVFTSPPFPLNTKKEYGNLQGEAYLQWFEGYAPLLSNLTTANGSIVIEIGNAWEPGHPVMSTLVMKAFLRFLEKGNLKLCQEFIWYNPARLPSPIQWVNVERIRVKDAFTRFWWMSKSERPKADNRRVLREYSGDMKKLLETGKYNAGPRPSEHVIGEKSFATNNGGSIPPNVLGAEELQTVGSLLKGTNTHSADKYQAYCRDTGTKQHPAKMPPELPEFFIKFLTDENDMVVDPFAGSNTTGSVAERLRRRWLSCEADPVYAASSEYRFRAKD